MMSSEAEAAHDSVRGTIPMRTLREVPDHLGRFGVFGGRFVPETLMEALNQLAEAYAEAKVDPEFQARLGGLLKDYVGRPSPLYLAERLSGFAGGAQIYLKREDLNHTGAHKINNAIGQVMLARRMGKTRVIAETGAGQHGVATATACALLGLDCAVYMGEEDTRRQALNVSRMRMLGAEVIPVATGTRTLKDAMNEAFRDWVTSVGHTHYCIGSVGGPHPFPRSTPSSLTPRFASLAARRAVTGSIPSGTRQPSPAARRACCTGCGRSCCRTRTARPSARTPSRPAWTTRAWARSTSG